MNTPNCNIHFLRSVSALRFVVDDDDDVLVVLVVLTCNDGGAILAIGFSTRVATDLVTNGNVDGSVPRRNILSSSTTFLSDDTEKGDFISFAIPAGADTTDKVDGGG